MESNTIQLTGGSNHHAPRSDMRAWAGYIPRQTVYRSTPIVSHPVKEQEPPLTFTPPEGLKLPSAQNTTQQQIYSAPPARQRVNYTGSFDMLNVKPKQSLQPQNSPPVIIAKEFTQPLPQAPSLSAQLPTDLPNNVLANQFGITGDTLKAKHGKLKFQLPKLTMPKVMVGMAVTLFIAGVGISALSLQTNNEVKAQVKSVATTQTKPDNDGGITDGVPDESGNAPSVEFYKVPTTNPRVIRIVKTNTEARILALGIAPTGALKAPANIFDAGWYKDSATPGEAGAMILDGHVSGPTKPGIFKKLGTLTKGDEIEIERGDGKKYTYTVTATKVFDADKLEMSSVMVPSVAGKPGLNIITCAGKFNKITNKYEQRTVVYSVLL